MKITILGSNAFRREMVENKNKLIELGHEVIVHPDYEAFVRGEAKDLFERMEKEHAKVKKENGYIKWYYNSIVNSDAVLVLNLNKNGKENYIGGNVLMEIGFAHVHGKKIYLYNPVPEYSSYIDEILAMYDEIINGDLTKIK